MPVKIFTANRKYPTIPTITDEIKSHTAALLAMQEAMQIYERRTKDIANSFVRVNELSELGLISISGGTTFNTYEVTPEWVQILNKPLQFLLRPATFISGNPITTPIADVYLVIPMACQIVRATLLTQGGPGSCVVDIRKDSYANFPPTGGDSICGGTKPTISSGVKYRDEALLGWDTAIAAEDILAVHVDSNSNFTMIQLNIEVQRAL